ncbi:MAG: hypothetical protein AAF125_05030, partial [Chloroflexota bacterium]
LSERQIRRLRTRDTTGLLVGLLLTTGLIGGGLWIMFSLGAILFGSVLILMGAAFFALTRVGRGRYTQEANDGTIATVQG